MRTKLFLLWQDFLDLIGIRDPWAQLAITGILQTILIFSVPALIIGIIIGRL